MARKPIAESTQPEDWDTEEDGEWEAPSIPNPKCKEAPGCGPWTRPLKPNPAFKGKWMAPMIDNPDFKARALGVVLCYGGFSPMCRCYCAAGRVEDCSCAADL